MSTEVFTVTLGKEYGYVLLTAITMQIQMILTGAAIGSQRKKHGVKYPDMGSGRHAAKLTEAAWTEFNNYQRAHYNYVENITPVTVLLLTGGLFYPLVSAGLGVTYIVGRYVYSTGYTSSGANGRGIGAGILHIGDIGLLGVSVYGILHKVLGLF
ncbi:hypothetical protein SmJEL517_g04816 [Synchytrium microbalum]|uniref:Glutathione transferase n=1 Tax=Synchytrium microbalum TaxID=1806994 RepID=A0A507C394_9FUNG|nr:uncharacterized protein SmJEL517_g04816 [Synchytrium microbalum]TPX31983.1 hypothetical protein SmJEL517_g04816 [Synchytrium microbalum]